MTGESRAEVNLGLERDPVPIVVVVGEDVVDAEEEVDEEEVVEEGVVEEVVMMIEGEVGVGVEVIVVIGAREEDERRARAGPDPSDLGGTTAWLGKGFPRASMG